MADRTRDQGEREQALEELSRYVERRTERQASTIYERLGNLGSARLGRECSTGYADVKSVARAAAM